MHYNTNSNMVEVGVRLSCEICQAYYCTHVNHVFHQNTHANRKHAFKESKHAFNEKILQNTVGFEFLPNNNSLASCLINRSSSLSSTHTLNSVSTFELRKYIENNISFITSTAPRWKRVKGQCPPAMKNAWNSNNTGDNNRSYCWEGCAATKTTNDLQ